MHQKRIQDPLVIDHTLIEQSLKENDEVIVQFSDKIYNDKILSEINDLCFEHDDRLTVRFYGHHSDVFDCGTIDKIPNVKSLSVDCLQKANHIEALTKPNNLKKLGLGIYELKETEILNAENFKNINKLLITDTKTKAFNLQYLENYKSLSYLINNGHTKNIETIGRLENLNYLSLNSISKVPLNFVNNLSQLKTLNIILGGRENIDEIKNEEIENLSLVWIRGLNELKNISNFKKLKSLRIEDQIRLPDLHFDTNLIDLSDIKILNCKTLNAITGLKNLSALDHLRIARTAIDFQSFIEQPLPSTLKIFAFYTFKSKIDKEIKAILNAKGYIDGLNR